MPKKNSNTDVTINISRADILSAALVGLEVQKQKVEEAISTLASTLEGGAVKQWRATAAPASSPGSKPPAKARKRGGKRQMGEAGRAAIKAALKTRWAKYRKTHPKAGK